MTKVRIFIRRFRTILMGVALVGIAFYITHKIYYHEEEKKDAFKRIRERGYLLALTDRNTLNYFLYRGEPSGFQLELLESFAAYLDVPLRIIASEDISKLYYYLNFNVADVIALNLPVSSEGRRLVHYSKIMGETRLILLQQKGTIPGFKKSLADFTRSDTVHARRNVFMSPYYRSFLKQTAKRPTLIEEPDISQEGLIRKVSDGSIRYLLCPENTAMVYKRYYQNLDASLVVFPLYAYAWGVNHNSDTLLMKLDEWLAGSKRSGEFKKTYLDYYANQKIVSNMRSDYVTLRGDHLSPFDKELRELSLKIHWDWRLLASLVYEESNFRLGQVSSRSAYGLMQLMPETAVKMGMDSIATPVQQLAAGVRYIKHLDEQLPNEITNPKDRIKFILASYNVGIGRVLLAREKAKKFGKDPNLWDRNVEYYLLRRSKKDPYAKNDTLDDSSADYTKAGFVDDIINRYYHYRNNIPQ
ncbi:MAG: transglycosylase SLT domain-containing protein [Bacteroidetes bacterium]|nr:transglycosylase SLT domain-containing protein [Bacteroidota bacterium]